MSNVTSALNGREEKGLRTNACDRGINGGVCMGRRLHPTAVGEAGQRNLGAMWRGRLKKKLVNKGF